MEARKRRELKKEREKSTLNGQSTSEGQATTNASGDQATSNDRIAANNQAALNGATALDSTAHRRHNGPRRRKFNLRVYKYHCLGDYANTIRRCGTTDSFSTELVSNYHEVFFSLEPHTHPSFRESWNTAHPKPDINAPIREHLSNNWLEWSVVKAVCVVSERDSHQRVDLQANLWPGHP